MSDMVETAVKAVAIGVGATAIMDVWLVLLKTAGVPTMNFALLGRWIGHVLRGTWFHAAIGKAAPVRNESAIGWAAHYAIGIGFAALLVAMAGAQWIDNPAFAPAVSMGLVTAAAPLFIMQPAMGSGFASSKTATPLRNCFKSVLNHAVFGSGLYLVAAALHGI